MWTALTVRPQEVATERRLLDLRTGTLVRERRTGAAPLRTLRFVSMARRGESRVERRQVEEVGQA